MADERAPKRPGSQRVRWILYVCLFDLAALVMMGLFGILYFFTSFIGWLFVPSGLVYGAAILLSLVLFTALYLLARRRQRVWFKALALGGASVPVLLAVLVLLGSLLFLGRGANDAARPNQQKRAVSPSGQYVLTVPIERSQTEKGPLGFGFPYWHVTIADPNGSIVYRDVEEKFAGIRNVYWMWGDEDIVWLFDSDDGTVYYYQSTAGQWARHRWGHNRTGYAEGGVAPPASLYLGYVPAGPVQNLGIPWQPTGYSGSRDPNGPVWISFLHTQTDERMMLRTGESENGVTLRSVDWDKKEVTVESEGRQFTLRLTWGP